MKCWVCNRQARGFGHADGRFKAGDPRRYPIDWVFCSRRCQDAFHRLWGGWQDSDPRLEEPLVIDASPLERAAMHKCLKPFGEAAGEIGFDKPLGQYSEDEALRVVDAIVTTYVDAMTEAHERTKYPSVRVNSDAAKGNPFADLKDDLPWEA